MITVIIAEDHQALIDGMKSFLKNERDIQIIGHANDGFSLIENARKLKPKVIITDIRMPKCDGILATKTIKAELPDTKIIAFSMFDHDDAISQMKEAAAKNGWPTKIEVGLIGSCTNSSYEDISRAVSLAKQVSEKNLKTKAEYMITPGSEQVRYTIERDGFLDHLDEFLLAVRNAL